MTYNIQHMQNTISNNHKYDLTILPELLAITISMI